LRCCHCKLNIASGAEARKMIVEYTQPDNSVKTFGYQMPDGPLTVATGTLLRGWHHKCWHVVRKRELRGDAVTGRVVAGIPTGYTAEAADSRALSDQLAELRAIAAEVGKAIGDPTVAEAYAARRHGRSPYPHRHQFRLDSYHLLAHLRYAHDVPFDVPDPEHIAGSMRAIHDGLHVAMVNGEARAARDADPGQVEPVDADWRDHTTADI
jgi:hypothetical protein